MSSVVKKFPMLSEFYDKLVTDNQNEKKYEVERLKGLISTTIKEFRKKNSDGYYEPQYCSEYITQLEIYINSLKNLRSNFSKNEYEELLTIILKEINMANGVLEYSNFVENEFGGRGM